MKKLTILLVCFAVAMPAFAQDEAFVKAMKKLEYGTTILDAAMLFKKDYPQFVPLSNSPVQVTVFTNPYDAAQKFKIEGYYLINDVDKQLITLLYVNDALYEKSVYWFLPKDSIELVQTNYAKARNMFLSNPVLIQIEAGKVKEVETSYELGKTTLFPIEKQGKKAREGRAGYELVYTKETGGQGFWVYISAYSTMENGLDSSMEFPHIAPPKGTFTDLRALLLPGEN